jgi:hypothetical protein
MGVTLMTAHFDFVGAVGHALHKHKHMVELRFDVAWIKVIQPTKGG